MVYIISMLRTQIYLPQKHIKQLKQKALDNQKTVSEILRELIEKSLEGGHKNIQNTGDWLLAMAEKAKKLKAKGPKDLAKNLDKYLYE